MTKELLHKIYLFIILSLGLFPALGQTTVKITADRNQILIGEQIRITLEAEIPENEPIRFFSPDTIPHFEILKRDKIDTVNTSRGTRLTGVIYLTSFDSGRWVIPPILLRDSIYSDSLVVDVGYTPFDVSKPYNDIKEIVEADEAKQERGEYWWYIAAGIGILLVILYFVFRKKVKPVAKVEVAEDPYDVAKRNLDELAISNPAKDKYYSRLVDIFRVYVQQKKGIESMQQTTGDLVKKLRDAGLVTGNYSELAEALELSDLVKFARFDASGEEDRQSLSTIRKSIEIIEQHKEGNE